MDERVNDRGSSFDTDVLVTSPDETAPQAEPLMLRTENLVKKYGKRTVVNHVSINVKQGEIVGVAWPKWCR